MQINKALLESSEITRHFMTDRERKVKKALCQLLVDKGHRKYAERFWKLDFNIVDSNKHPKFTAAISFDEATVFISDGFLGSGQGIFNQLDVLLRHEMAHNLMMHQIRMMHVFKKLHANDPDEAYEHIRYSASLHDILNIIEDFEISNKRYSAEDKKIVRNMQLNGRVIGGLVTEDHRGWDKMPLEAMYDELTKDLIRINSEIRSDPYWQPRSKIDGNKRVYDIIDVTGSGMADETRVIAAYRNVMKPSGVKAPLDIFIKSKVFTKMAKIYQNIVTILYDRLKDLTSDAEKALLLDIVNDIAATNPVEKFNVVHPITGGDICTLYTPEDKMIANDVLKNLAGNINYDPMKFKVKKKQNTQKYKDAWNNVVNKLDSNKFDNETLQKLRDAIEAM
jgi:hypothetical protein